MQELISRNHCICKSFAALEHPDTGVDGTPPALALVDAGPDAAAWIAALRAMPGLWGSTPVLAVGDEAEAGPLPAAGWISPPLQPDAALAAIEQWTGPLADQGLRDPEDPGYRLLRLVGMERATAMLGRLADQLEEALAVLAAPVDLVALRPLAHRIAGVAGLHGFSELGQAWLAVDRGESADVEDIARLTRAALATVHKWS